MRRLCTQLQRASGQSDGKAGDTALPSPWTQSHLLYCCTIASNLTTLTVLQKSRVGPCYTTCTAVLWRQAPLHHLYCCTLASDPTTRPVLLYSRSQPHYTTSFAVLSHRAHCTPVLLCSSLVPHYTSCTAVLSPRTPLHHRSC